MFPATLALEADGDGDGDGSDVAGALEAGALGEADGEAAGADDVAAEHPAASTATAPNIRKTGLFTPR